MSNLPIFTIYRTEATANEVLGTATLFNLAFRTVERPWKNNAKGESCIPAGDYVCKWQLSPSKGWCYQITNVPNRDRILIHSANFASELQGCVALGTERMHGDRKGVANSRLAMDLLHSAAKKEPFILRIEWLCAVPKAPL